MTNSGMGGEAQHGQTMQQMEHEGLGSVELPGAWEQLKHASGAVLHFVGDMTVQFKNPVPSEHFREVPPENENLDEYPSTWLGMP